MKSDDSDRSGRAARSLRTTDLNSSTEYPRFMAARIRSEPDCTGKCRCDTSCGSFSYTSNMRGVISRGCEVV